MSQAAARVHLPSVRVRALALVRIPEPAERVPRWRGFTHEKAFAFTPALAVLLVSSADDARDCVAGSLFSVTLTLMLGVSMVNHRASFPARWNRVLRRLDHTTANLFFAGTWTSFALFLSGATTLTVSAMVWAGAILASLVTITWVDVPGWVPATIAVGAGWLTTPVLPQLARALGPLAFGLFVLGGASYMAGMLVYGMRRPNPIPADVGYHEIFHAFVLVGATCHYIALVFFVLPASA